MKDIQIEQDYIPGAIGRITELHAAYYSKHWNFGLFFEARVATELSAFLTRFDKNRDGFWTVCKNSRIQGSIVIDGKEADTKGAHLRWFIMSTELQGSGFGNKLMDKAMSFCKMKRYNKVYLNTFEGLNSARHLYEKYGFQLVEQNQGAQWGTKVVEQRFVFRLK